MGAAEQISPTTWIIVTLSVAAIGALGGILAAVFGGMAGRRGRQARDTSSEVLLTVQQQGQLLVGLVQTVDTVQNTVSGVQATVAEVRRDLDHTTHQQITCPARAAFTGPPPHPNPRPNPA